MKRMTEGGRREVELESRSRQAKSGVRRRTLAKGVRWRKKQKEITYVEGIGTRQEAKEGRKR